MVGSSLPAGASSGIVVKRRKLQSPGEVPGRIWVDVAKLGTRVIAQGDQPEIPFTPVVVGQIMANYRRKVIPRPPVLKQHNGDGVVRGDIYALRIKDGWLQALIDLKFPEDRRSYNLGALREFSPFVHLNWVDPHTGVDYGAVISEISFVSEPAQLTLRTPQEINPGVRLQRLSMSRSNLLERIQLRRELRRLEAEDKAMQAEEESAMQAEDESAMQAIPEPDETVAELRAQIAEMGRRLADAEEALALQTEENAMAGDEAELDLLEVEEGAGDATPTTVTDETMRELTGAIADLGARLEAVEDRAMVYEEDTAAAGLSRQRVRGRSSGPVTRSRSLSVPKLPPVEERGSAFYSELRTRYGKERAAEILHADRQRRRAT